MASWPKAYLGLTPKELALFTSVSVSLTGGLALHYPFHVALGSAFLLLAASIITRVDIATFIIPNAASYATFAAGMILGAPPGWWDLAAFNSLAGAALGGGALLLLRIGYRRWRGFDGLGLGDVKLVAAGGAWLGVFDLPLWLLLACLLAIAHTLARAAAGTSEAVTRTTPIPFGAYLALSLWLLWTYRKLIS